MKVVAYVPLPELNDVGAFDASDEACLKDVAETLRRHGKLTRFGVTLLHRHFEIGTDEVLLETNDDSDRSLWMRPVSKASLGKLDATPTSWRLDAGKVEISCVCTKNSSSGKHEHVHLR